MDSPDKVCGPVGHTAWWPGGERAWLSAPAPGWVKVLGDLPKAVFLTFLNLLFWDLNTLEELDSCKD